IRVTDLTEAPADFNARFRATAKCYVYSLDLGREPDPLSARYAWHVPFPIDLERLRALLPLLEGTHDFAGFQSVGNPAKRTVRTLFSARLDPGGLIQSRDAAVLWRIEFRGDGFLYHMVRNITGTVIEIARGRFAPEFLEESLQSPGPFRGHCAPAHGLALASVEYAAFAANESAP
ncbi:MAG TPA: tRNA pseudouridine(38-40) synthase TruA, partial [Candidatus Hydrogenedentes bacterium]|nr:tRNA pseudouridine(38-40) synthase TruA [Candidatus Hydrogenedentota bacterium]